MSNETLGFVALGHMGRPIACNLLKAGYTLRTHDRDPRANSSLVFNPQVEAVATVGGTVASGGVVFSMVDNDDALRSIALHPDGILTRLGPGGVHVSLSTISPDLAQELEQGYAGQGAWCGECPPCREGRTNICERYYLLGIHDHGGMAERALYPASMCVPVPRECTPEAAVLAQPCAIAVHAINRAGIKPGQTIAIFGVGGIGSLVLAVLQVEYKGSLTIFAVDVAAGALQTAMRLAASYVIDSSLADPIEEIAELTGNHRCQVVIEATGATSVMKQALASVGRGGRLLQLGIPIHPANLLVDRLVVEEKELIGSNGQINATDLTRALTLLTETDLAAHIQTHIIELDDLVECGFKPLVEHRAGGKIMVNISCS